MADSENDPARLEAIQSGLPPEVHDPALLAGYAAFAERRGKASTEQAKPKPKAKGKAK